MRVLGVIPVRGGSKGVPGKNLRLFAGRPLLWYSITAARSALRLTRLIVSTDDDSIASFAESAGATVLHHPKHLSVDDAPTYPVVQWALAELERTGQTYDVVAVLRATTPLRTSGDIDGALDVLSSHNEFDSVVTVNAVPGIHPIRLKRVLADGCLVDAFSSEGYSPIRRQELEPLYVRNGGLYGARVDVIRSKGLWGDRCAAYVMPENRSTNINTDFQFQLAELCYLNEQRAAAPTRAM